MGPRSRRLAAIAAVVPLVLATQVAGATKADGSVPPEPEPAEIVGARLAVLPAVGPASAPGATAPALAAAVWSWPLQPQPIVLARFDASDVTWGAGHRGVDLAASIGQEVLAPSAGVVTFSAVVVDRGVVVVTTASGLRSTFEPVDGGVPVGTAVTQRATVGHVSATPGHCRPATCLHWGVLRGPVYLDPLGLVDRRPFVLLPLRPR